MPTKEKTTTAIVKGEEMEAVEMVFTNGVLSEMRELQEFFGAKSLKELVETSLSVLKNIKKSKENA